MSAATHMCAIMRGNPHQLNLLLFLFHAGYLAQVKVVFIIKFFQFNNFVVPFFYLHGLVQSQLLQGGTRRCCCLLPGSELQNSLNVTCFILLYPVLFFLVLVLLKILCLLRIQIQCCDNIHLFCYLFKCIFPILAVFPFCPRCEAA